MGWVTDCTWGGRGVRCHKEIWRIFSGRGKLLKRQIVRPRQSLGQREEHIYSSLIKVCLKKFYFESGVLSSLACINLGVTIPDTKMACIKYTIDNAVHIGMIFVASILTVFKN